MLFQTGVFLSMLHIFLIPYCNETHCIAQAPNKSNFREKKSSDNFSGCLPQNKWNKGALKKTSDRRLWARKISEWELGLFELFRCLVPRPRHFATLNCFWVTWFQYEKCGYSEPFDLETSLKLNNREGLRESLQELGIVVCTLTFSIVFHWSFNKRC